MRKPAKRLVLIFSVLIVMGGLVYFIHAVELSLGFMHTMDREEYVVNTLLLVLGTNNVDSIDVASETQKMFPQVPVSNDRVLDGWRHPIRVTIRRLDAGFSVTVVSAGPDGKFGTKDDIAQTHAIP